MFPTVSGFTIRRVAPLLLAAVLLPGVSTARHARGGGSAGAIAAPTLAIGAVGGKVQATAAAISDTFTIGSSTNAGTAIISFKPN